MSNYFKKQKDVIINENPTFVSFLALCPTLAVTVLFSGSVWMGLSVIFVLTFSNMFISLIRNLVPNNIRIPVYITIIATLVTVIIMVLQTYFPSVYDQLGIYLPLIVVNCIILGRAESFAKENPVIPSMIDGFTVGVAFTVSLLVIGFIRELFGTGSVKMLHISIGQLSESAQIFQTGAGAFITVGILAWTFNNWKSNRAKKLKQGGKK